MSQSPDQGVRRPTPLPRPAPWTVCRTLGVAILTAIAAHPTPVRAVEAASMRALQTGPVGQGPAFTTLGKSTTEVLYGYISSKGDEASGADRKRSSRVTHMMAVGQGFDINRDLNFVLQLASRSTIYDASTRVSPKFTESMERSDTEIFAGPSLWFGQLMLGAHAGMEFLGKESRAVETVDGTARTTVDACLVPRIRLFSAVKSEGFVGMARLLLYNDALSEATTARDGESLDYDVKQRRAGEFSVDTHYHLDPKFTLAADFTYVAAGQAAEDSGQHAVTFAGVTTAEPVRAETGDRMQTDYFRLGLGASYAAESWFNLVGAYHYTEASFAEEHLASLMHENIGGTRLDIGAQYGVPDYKAYFNLGYSIPDRATYTNPDKGLPTWKTAGEKTGIELASWDLQLGGTFAW